MNVTNFNLRVYGLLISNDSVLITHESRKGFLMTKFPGGGLEKGEGITDCLQREFKEELDIEINVQDQFYVNDFLQISAFNPADQLISFYYNVFSKELDKIDLTKKEVMDFEDQTFEWVKFRNLGNVDFTFPIDKKVVSRLIESHT